MKEKCEECFVRKVCRDCYDIMQGHFEEEAQEQSDLKPCPFCGGDAVLDSYPDYEAERSCDPTEWYVQCTSCGITINGYYDPIRAKKAWNKRVDIPKGEQK